MRKNKFEVLWEGPFEVIRHDEDCNVFKLNISDNKTVQANLKQLRFCREGENVVVNDIRVMDL